MDTFKINGIIINLNSNKEYNDSIKLYYFDIISITFVFISFILPQRPIHHLITRISFRMYYILFKNK